MLHFPRVNAIHRLIKIMKVLNPTDYLRGNNILFKYLQNNYIKIHCSVKKKKNKAGEEGGQECSLTHLNSCLKS